jgi:hypothetical protein
MTALECFETEVRAYGRWSAVTGASALERGDRARALWFARTIAVTGAGYAIGNEGLIHRELTRDQTRTLLALLDVSWRAHGPGATGWRRAVQITARYLLRLWTLRYLRR